MSDRSKHITRRRMLTRLGLGIAAIYVAPVLVRLSEARASSFSGPDSSGPRSRKPRNAGSNSGPSFSDARKRTQEQGVQRRVRVGSAASSFSR